MDDLHGTLSQARESTTCEWVVQEEGFRQWRNGEKSVYAILGPGACPFVSIEHRGDSILMTVHSCVRDDHCLVCTVSFLLCRAVLLTSLVPRTFIIEHLRAELRTQISGTNPAFTVAYFYFRETVNTDSQNDGLALMKSLILQLVRASPQCWRHLRHKLPKLGAPPLTSEQLLDILREMVGIRGRLGLTYIAIDGLDECHSKDPRSSGTQEHMLELLTKLHDLSLRLPTLRLLVASRPERSIVRSLEQLSPTVLKLSETREHRDDIATYVKANLPTDEPWNDDMRDRATKALTDLRKSQGM